MLREMGPVTTMPSAWPGRSDEIDAEAGQIEKRGGQNVKVRFACVAAGGRYLAKLKRPAEELFKVLSGMRSQVREVTRGDQVLFFGNGNGKILGESYQLAFANTLAGSAEDTASHVDGFGRRIDGLLGAGRRTCGRPHPPAHQG